MKLAVLGATSTACSRTASRIKGRGLAVVEASRATGINLIRGTGLTEALEGVDVASNAFPPDDAIGLHDALRRWALSRTVGEAGELSLFSATVGRSRRCRSAVRSQVSVSGSRTVAFVRVLVGARQRSRGRLTPKTITATLSYCYFQ